MKKIKEQKERREEIMKRKEKKVMKMIKAKNELTEGIEELFAEDLLLEQVGFRIFEF